MVQHPSFDSGSFLDIVPFSEEDIYVGWLTTDIDQEIPDRNFVTLHDSWTPEGLSVFLTSRMGCRRSRNPNPERRDNAKIPRGRDNTQILTSPSEKAAFGYPGSDLTIPQGIGISSRLAAPSPQWVEVPAEVAARLPWNAVN